MNPAGEPAGSGAFIDNLHQSRLEDDLQRLLLPAGRTVVGNGPVKPSQTQKALAAGGACDVVLDVSRF